MINAIVNWIVLTLTELNKIVALAFEYIFPEYPQIGTFLGMGVLALFLIYTLKSGVKPAAKISFTIFVSAIFFLYLLHTIFRLLNLRDLF